MRSTALTSLSFFSIFSLLSASWVGAQQKLVEPQKLEDLVLSVEAIYSGSSWSSKSYAGHWLSQSDHQFVRVEETEDQKGKGIVLYHAPDWQREVLVEASELWVPGTSTPLNVESFSLSKDRSRVLIYTNSKRVWRRNTRGDYWVLDRSARQLRQLGKGFPESTLMFAKFSPDGSHVAYVQDRCLYVEDLLSGEIRRLSDQQPHLISGTSDWVNEEELGIRDGFRWSADGTQIAYWQFDITGVPVMTMVDNTSQMYPRLIEFPYPKTGQLNSAARVGVVGIEGVSTTWIDLPGDPREHYISKLQWGPLRPGHPQQLVLQQLNRLQNTNRIFLANPETGNAENILVETDKAWVDSHDEMFWIDRKEEFTWISERQGYRSVYLCDVDGDSRLVTPAGIDAIELLHVSGRTGDLFVIASPDNATQRYLYRASLHADSWERVTPEDKSGTHSYQISPSGLYAIHTYSNINTPPITQLISLPDHKQLQVLEDNAALLKKLNGLQRKPAELFRVEIQPGIELDGWCIEPPKIDPAKKYPLLVYVYGEPAGTTVRDRWGGSTFLWHQMLAQHGYVVMSFDNRGTPSPKGRAWRKSVYRNVGINAPKDQAAAVGAVLAGRSYLDDQRVGVWGWSGGGSMSLHAIFRYPDLYKTAISIAPVPNMRYYDTIYQERYMGVPSDNVEGYRNGSPITHAKNLKGKLLLVHGTGDDNCHYATMEMLINELIRHNKPLDMMSYPNRTHSIREGKNTTLHLRKLMTRYIHENLPPGPVSK